MLLFGMTRVYAPELYRCTHWPLSYQDKTFNPKSYLAISIVAIAASFQGSGPANSD